jgi:hypothetical protein
MRQGEAGGGFQGPACQMKEEIFRGECVEKEKGIERICQEGGTIRF